MKALLSLILSGALMLGAASFAFGKNVNGAKQSSHHRSSHHRTSGSHRGGVNSGSKTHSNIPSN